MKKTRRTIIMGILLSILLGATLATTGCKAEKSTPVKTTNSKVACFKVEGMTCAACSSTLKVSVRKLKGINSVEASSDDGSAEVSYEPSVINEGAIKSNIDSVGYKATQRNCQKNEG